MSTYKLVIHGKPAREKLAKGADQLAQAVISTLGPSSRNVGLNRPLRPIIVHDGVTIAQEIRLKDPFEDMGAVFLREAASNTNDLAGDGTTTATLLGNTLIQEGFKLVEGGVVDGVMTGRVNPMAMRKELLQYADIIIEEIIKKAKKLEKNEWEAVAAVSAADAVMGTLVAQALEKVGPDGLVMIERTTSFDSSIDVQEGTEFDNGLLSPYFVTDSDRMIAEYQDGYILLTDYLISDPMTLVPLVEKVIKEENKPLLIIADDVVGPALQALVLTKLKAGARLVAVVAPEFADRRREALEDLAILTGGRVISRDIKKPLQDVELADLGRFRSLKVSLTHTTITPKNPDTEEIKERSGAIKKQILEEENRFRLDKLIARLAKLSQSVVTINVGGGSESEIKDKEERINDAVHATKAAIAEGVVAGGGVCLRDIARDLKPIGDAHVHSLVLRALRAPYETILRNAGISVDGEHPEGYGMDVVTGNDAQMLAAMIMDPAKVTRLAIKHAFSIAATVLTTECLVSADPEEERAVQKVRPV